MQKKKKTFPNWEELMECCMQTCTVYVRLTHNTYRLYSVTCHYGRGVT